MSWILLVVFSSAFSAISTILNRKFVDDKNTDSVTYATFFQFACAFIFLLVGILLGKLTANNLFMYWQNFLLQGILYGVGSIFMFKSLKFGEAPKFTVIFSTQALFTILGAFFILGEVLTPIHWIAVILLLGSVVLVSFTPDSINFDNDEWYALFAAVCFGFARVNDKILIVQMNFYLFLFLGFFLPGLFLLIWNSQSVKKFKRFATKARLKHLGIVSSVYSIGSIAFYLALSVGKSIQVVTASVVGVVFTEILSIIFLNERRNILRKVLGSLLAIVGLIVIAL